VFDESAPCRNARARDARVGRPVGLRRAAGNFTGTWQLDKTRSVLPASVPSRGDTTMVIDHKGDTLKIERHAEFMGMHRTFKATYYTDGR